MHVENCPKWFLYSSGKAVSYKFYLISLEQVTVADYINYLLLEFKYIFFKTKKSKLY